MLAEDKVKQFVLAVADAAIRDAQGKIPARAAINTGRVLPERLGLSRYRAIPRNGDGSEARRIYTAVRFLYQTELKTD